MNRIVLAILAILFAGSMAHAQSTWPTPQSPTGGPSVTGGVGMYVNSSGQAVPETNADPCSIPASTKVSAVVSITTATTTQIVPLVAGQSVYICGGVLTIAPSATTADTATLVYGTGTNCATGLTALSGAFGAGDLTTAAPPIVVPLASSGIVTSAPAGKALCLTSAGATVNIQGVISYVQQ